MKDKSESTLIKMGLATLNLIKVLSLIGPIICQFFVYQKKIRSILILLEKLSS